MHEWFAIPELSQLKLMSIKKVARTRPYTSTRTCRCRHRHMPQKFFFHSKPQYIPNISQSTSRSHFILYSRKYIQHARFCGSLKNSYAIFKRNAKDMVAPKTLWMMVTDVWEAFSLPLHKRGSQLRTSYCFYPSQPTMQYELLWYRVHSCRPLKASPHIWFVYRTCRLCCAALELALFKLWWILYSSIIPLFGQRNRIEYQI